MVVIVDLDRILLRREHHRVVVHSTVPKIDVELTVSVMNVALEQGGGFMVPVSLNLVLMVLKLKMSKALLKSDERGSVNEAKLQALVLPRDSVIEVGLVDLAIKEDKKIKVSVVAYLLFLVYCDNSVVHLSLLLL